MSQVTHNSDQRRERLLRQCGHLLHWAAMAAGVLAVGGVWSGLRESRAELEPLKTNAASQPAAPAGRIEQAQAEQEGLQHTVSMADYQALQDRLDQALKLRDETSAELARLRSAHDALAAKLASSAAELAAVGKARQDELLALRMVEADLTRLRTEQNQWFTIVQRAYLVAAGGGAAPAGGPTHPQGEAPTLPARQSAARAGGLLDRAATVRPLARTSAGQEAVDAAEIVLTRLDMLDADMASSHSSFAELLTSSGALGRLRTAAAANDESPLVRAWLTEARLVLDGAERAIW